MAPRKETPIKFCEAKSCGKKLERKRLPCGQLEMYQHFLRRKYCGFPCMALAFEERKQAGEAATSTLVRQVRELLLPGPCEKCGKPAEEVHHKDRNKRNASPENLIRLCGPCHLAEHGKIERHKIQRSRRASNAKCSLCGGTVFAKGLCQTHYMTDLRRRKREG